MLNRLKSMISRRLFESRYSPAFSITKSERLVRIGSSYGGWTFEESPDLTGSTVISCGLGEDASFDVEFATRFKAKVIVVDPTPKAMRHFAAIQERLGQPANRSYIRGGRQPVDAYNLIEISKGSLLLEPRALWTEKTKLKFFAPLNPDHVSHTVIESKDSRGINANHLVVDTTTLEDLVARYKLTTLPLMKIDIEGAEIPVIKHMVTQSSLPRQLLVEFDELNMPSAEGRDNVMGIDVILRQTGYECRYFDGRSNVLYVLGPMNG